MNSLVQFSQEHPIAFKLLIWLFLFVLPTAIGTLIGWLITRQPGSQVRETLREVPEESP